MHPPDQATVTRLLDAVRHGDREALNDLFPLVYHELHAQAQRQRRNWQGNLTLNTTALVHEAYLKMVDQSQAVWQSRAHFLYVAAQAMRHILIDYARKSKRIKRGGSNQPVPFDDLQHQLAAPNELTLLNERAEEFLSLNHALERLAAISKRQSAVVECRFFGGMTIPDTACALGISAATVKRDWVVAQAWLYREMKRFQDS